MSNPSLLQKCADCKPNTQTQTSTLATQSIKETVKLDAQGCITVDECVALCAGTASLKRAGMLEQVGGAVKGRRSSIARPMGRMGTTHGRSHDQGPCSGWGRAGPDSVSCSCALEQVGAVGDSEARPEGPAPKA